MRQIVAGSLIVILVGTGIALLLARPALAQGGDCIRVGGDLLINADERCPGDGIAIGGDLIVHGGVDGNAVAIGGSVQVEGVVGGDVVSLAGQVGLQREAQVAGDAVALGGFVHQAPGAIVQGNVLESAIAMPGWAIGADRPSSWGTTRLGVALLACVLTLGLSLLLAVGLRSWLPRRTGVMVDTLRDRLIASLGMGIVTTLLLVVLLPLASIILGVIVIGLPLIPFLYVIAALLYALGLAVAGLTVGEAMSGSIEGARSSRWLPPLLGLVVLVPLAVFPGLAIPCLGPAWAALIPSGGVGAILLSRAGTMAWTGGPRPGRHT